MTFGARNLGYAANNNIIVTPLPGGNSYASRLGSNTVTLSWARAGTVVASKTASASWDAGPVSHDWATSPTPTIGDSYWIRADSTSGTPSTGTTGVWFALSSTQAWTVTRSSIGVKTWTATFSISSDSSGIPILSQGSYSLQAIFDS